MKSFLIIGCILSFLPALQGISIEKVGLGSKEVWLEITGPDSEGRFFARGTSNNLYALQTRPSISLEKWGDIAKQEDVITSKAFGGCFVVSSRSINLVTGVNESTQLRLLENHQINPSFYPFPSGYFCSINNINIGFFSWDHQLQWSNSFIQLHKSPIINFKDGWIICSGDGLKNVDSAGKKISEASPWKPFQFQIAISNDNSTIASVTMHSTVRLFDSELRNLGAFSNGMKVTNDSLMPFGQEFLVVAGLDNVFAIGVDGTGYKLFSSGDPIQTPLAQNRDRTWFITKNGSLYVISKTGQVNHLVDLEGGFQFGLYFVEPNVLVAFSSNGFVYIINVTESRDIGVRRRELE